MVNNITFGASLNINTGNDKNALSKKSVKHLTNLAKDIVGDVIKISIDKSQLKTKGQSPKVVHNLKLTQGKFVSEHKDLPFKTNLTELIEKIFDNLKAEIKVKQATNNTKRNKLVTSNNVSKKTPKKAKEPSYEEIIEKERQERMKELGEQAGRAEKGVVQYIKTLGNNPDNCKLNLLFTSHYGANPFYKMSLNQLKSLSDITNKIQDKAGVINVDVDFYTRNYFAPESSKYSYNISSTIYGETRASSFNAQKSDIYESIKKELTKIQEHSYIPLFDENLDSKSQILNICKKIKQQDLVIERQQKQIEMLAKFYKSLEGAITLIAETSDPYGPLANYERQVKEFRKQFYYIFRM